MKSNVTKIIACVIIFCVVLFIFVYVEIVDVEPIDLESQNTYIHLLPQETNVVAGVKKNSNNITLSEIKRYISIDNTTACEDDGDFSVAIIDSGVFPHTALKEKIATFVDFVYDKPLAYDDSGHGTQVSGIIAASKTKEDSGLAPFVNIVALKVLNQNNVGDSDDIKEALKWVIRHQSEYNIRIVNMSIGFSFENNEELKELCQEAYENDLIIVSAVGNKTVGETFDGMLDEHIILVGSMEYDFENNKEYIADYSQEIILEKGIYKPDIYTFGSNIYTTDSNTSYKGNENEEIHYSDKYISVTGTSYSAAVISGYLCNIIKNNPSYSIDEVINELYETDNYLYSEENKYQVPIARSSK